MHIAAIVNAFRQDTYLYYFSSSSSSSSSTSSIKIFLRLTGEKEEEDAHDPKLQITSTV